MELGYHKFYPLQPVPPLSGYRPEDAKIEALRKAVNELIEHNNAILRELRQLVGVKKVEKDEEVPVGYAVGAKLVEHQQAASVPQGETGEGEKTASS